MDASFIHLHPYLFSSYYNQGEVGLNSPMSQPISHPKVSVTHLVMLVKYSTFYFVVNGGSSEVRSLLCTEFLIIHIIYIVPIRHITNRIHLWISFNGKVFKCVCLV